MSPELFNELLYVPGMSVVFRKNMHPGQRLLATHDLSFDEDGWSWSSKPASVLPNPMPDWVSGSTPWTKTIFLLSGVYASRFYTNGDRDLEHTFTHCCKLICDVQVNAYFAETLEEYQCGPLMIVTSQRTDVVMFYFTKEADALMFMMLIHAKAIPNLRDHATDPYRNGERR